MAVARVADIWLRKHPPAATPHRMAFATRAPSCQTHLYSDLVWSVPCELQIQVPACRQGWTKAGSTLSPAAGAANSEGPCGRRWGQKLFHMWSSTFVKVSLQHSRGGSTATSPGYLLQAYPVGQRFHYRTSIFPCYSFCFSVLTTECMGRRQGRRARRGENKAHRDCK